jgi:hypothetical protein
MTAGAFSQLQVSAEAVSTGVNLVDRCLSLRAMDKPETKLLAVAAIFTGSKMHDTQPISLVSPSYGTRTVCCECFVPTLTPLTSLANVTLPPPP